MPHTSAVNADKNIPELNEMYATIAPTMSGQTINAKKSAKLRKLEGNIVLTSLSAHATANSTGIVVPFNIPTTKMLIVITMAEPEKTPAHVTTAAAMFPKNIIFIGETVGIIL